MGRNSSTAAQHARSFLFLCLVLALLAGSGWWVLQRELTFGRLVVAGVEIRDLSLRLDRGLVTRADRLVLPDGGGAGSGAGWEGWVVAVKKWGRLFREIEISSVVYRGQAVALRYREGVFRVQGEQFSADAVLAYRDNTVWLRLIEARFLSRDLVLSGYASYAPGTARLLFAGRFRHPLVAGTVAMDEKDGRLEVALATGEFRDLVPLLAQFGVTPAVLGWIDDNISADSYRITDLRLRFDLGNLAAFGADDISGTAVADRVAIRFHPGLEPVRTDRVHISFAGDRLRFALDKPAYRDKSLQGSSVVIDNVIGAGSTLGIDLVARTPKDKVVDELLDQYGLNFPARQTAGSTGVNLRLLFALSDFRMAVAGRVESGAGTWLWRDTPLQTTGITVELANRLLRFRRAELAAGDTLRARVSGVVDAGSRHGDLDLVVDSLALSMAGTTLVQAAGVRTPLLLDGGEGVVLARLPELRTAIRAGAGHTVLAIDSLPALLPYSALLQKLGLDDGVLRVAFAGDRLRFAGETEIPNTLLSLAGQPVSRFRFQGVRTPARTDIAVNDNAIVLSWTDEVAVNLTGYLLTLDGKDFAGGDAPSFPVPLRITGDRTLVRVRDQEIATGRFVLQMKEAELSFRSELEKGTIVFASSPAGKSFVGRDLDAALVDRFMKNSDVSDGTMHVFLKGKADDFEGYLEMNRILIRGTKLLNNILAFINAVPALATLTSPGFDREGYRVDEGVVQFHYREPILAIDELRTNGVAINTAARGWINNRDRTLELSMDLIALKDYSKILGKIPLAGYAILGEDGSLSTSLDIRGGIDHPEITTNLTQEILMSPINIIKRTVEWPFRLLDKLRGPGAEEVPEPE